MTHCPVYKKESSEETPFALHRRELLIGAGITGFLAAGTGRASAQMGAKTAAASVVAPMADMIPAGHDQNNMRCREVGQAISLKTQPPNIKGSAADTEYKPGHRSMFAKACVPGQ
jgi:hypothetical protein